MGKWAIYPLTRKCTRAGTFAGKWVNCVNYVGKSCGLAIHVPFMAKGISWMCVECGLFDFIEGMWLCMSFSLSYEGLCAGGVWVWVKWGAVCFH